MPVSRDVLGRMQLVLHFEGVSPKDPLYRKRAALLAKINIEVNRSFAVCAIDGNLPTSPDLIYFLRVFHMDEGWWVCACRLHGFPSRFCSVFCQLRDCFVYIGNAFYYLVPFSVAKLILIARVNANLERSRFLPCALVNRFVCSE